jgi:hypothetical protein
VKIDTEKLKEIRKTLRDAMNTVSREYKKLRERERYHKNLKGNK